MGQAPADDLPRTQFTNEGPDVLLEVEAELGALFEEGMLIEADWCPPPRKRRFGYGVKLHVHN